MDQIAQKSQLAKGTLYLYFQSKEEVFLELKEREYALWFQEMGKFLGTISGTLSVEEKKTKFVKQVVQSFEKKQDRLRLIASLHHLLERNISLEKIMEFNRKIGASILEVGSLLEEKFPFLKKGDGAFLLLAIKSIAIGLNHTSEIAPVLKTQKVTPPEFLALQVPFSKSFERLLTLLLAGFSS